MAQKRHEIAVYVDDAKILGEFCYFFKTLQTAGIADEDFRCGMLDAVFNLCWSPPTVEC